LLVSGQASAALDSLRILGRYASRQGGRVPHEITQNGDLFNPGNTVETSQYVRAVEQAYRWTGDRAFLDEVYGVCREGIFAYMLGECNPKGDLLPDGPGMLELSTAHHGKKLDVACSLYQGLHSLAYLAAAMGDQETATRSARLAGEVRERINRYFWVPERQEYVWRIEPDLTAHADEPAHSYAVLEMGVLGRDEEPRIAGLFEKVEGPEHTGPKGMVHPGTEDFVMPIQNAMVALAEFRYGRPDEGLWYLERMAELRGASMPWAIPEFEGPKGCFLQAWSSAAFNWLLVQGFLRLNPDPLTGTVSVQPQLPRDWPYLEVNNLAIWGRTCDLRIARGKHGIEFSATQYGAGKDELRFDVALDPDIPVTFV
jgi:glycogen debranching enzyme